MALGTAIFLIALGAILRFAVTATIVGIDIRVVGTILMVAGAIGLVISLIFMFRSRRQPPGSGMPPQGGQVPPPPPPQRY